MIGTSNLTNAQVAALAAATIVGATGTEGFFDRMFDHILSKLDSVKPTIDSRTFGDA